MHKKSSIPVWYRALGLYIYMYMISCPNNDCHICQTFNLMKYSFYNVHTTSKMHLLDAVSIYLCVCVFRKQSNAVNSMQFSIEK